MNNQALIECVPNFSEGRDEKIIQQIAQSIQQVEGVELLDVDPGKATNRTVMTMVGAPEAVIEAAFQAIKTAANLIDMRQHSGEHPRMGATDVCPLIPISNITMEETVEYSRRLAERVGEELGISIFLYESSASDPRWKNLANIRSGEYEKMASKLQGDNFKPDFGPATLNEKAGVTAIGARDFLIAYNVNLNTTSTRRANSVAFDVREAGRIKREGHPVTGKIVRDEAGNAVRTPGTCKAVKGIGWFIEEYGIAQVSMNLTDIHQTPLHEVFEACCNSALARGMRVTGSELIGLIPLQVMLDAGKYYLRKQQRSVGVAESEIIKIAIKSMGLDELQPFDPQQKIIEYRLAATQATPLLDMSLPDFAYETASESPAPGGGSIAAYVGSLGAALGTMVANLSANKRGWDEQLPHFSARAEQGQFLLKRLLAKVDEDTAAFNGIMEAFRLPKGTDAEKQARQEAIQAATKNAVEVPFEVMELAFECLDLLEDMARNGNPNSISDVGVGTSCIHTAVYGAYLNVLINLKDIKDEEYANRRREDAYLILESLAQREQVILDLVHQTIDS